MQRMLGINKIQPNNFLNHSIIFCIKLGLIHLLFTQRLVKHSKLFPQIRLPQEIKVRTDWPLPDFGVGSTVVVEGKGVTYQVKELTMSCRDNPYIRASPCITGCDLREWIAERTDKKHSTDTVFVIYPSRGVNSILEMN